MAAGSAATFAASYNRAGVIIAGTVRASATATAAATTTATATATAAAAGTPIAGSPSHNRHGGSGGCGSGGCGSGSGGGGGGGSSSASASSRQMRLKQPWAQHGYQQQAAEVVSLTAGAAAATEAARCGCTVGNCGALAAVRKLT